MTLMEAIQRTLNVHKHIQICQKPKLLTSLIKKMARICPDFHFSDKIIKMILLIHTLKGDHFATLISLLILVQS